MQGTADAKVSDEELKAALEVVFRANRQLYAQRGFQRRIGFGQKPALLIIDLANAWTRSGHAFSCANMDAIISTTQQLLEAFRERQLPVVFTTMSFQDVSGKNSDVGALGFKCPLETLQAGSEAVQIDSRIPPLAGEQVVPKKNASAFHGTHLSNYLTSLQVDTVVVVGVTASACIRHTIEDAIANGFRPIAVREGVGDRIAGAVEYNLFDIGAKFGDVEPLERVLAHLSSSGEGDGEAVAPPPKRAKK